MRATVYARYSSEGQREASVEDQFRNCQTRAEKEGWQIGSRYQDKGISGTQDEKGRPGYKAMLDAARAKQFDVLLVDDLSRLSRDEAELILTRRKLLFWGLRLVGVSDGYDSDAKGHKIQATMRGLMNDIFLDDLKAKTHRGMAGQALKGYSTGSRVYGYRRVPIEDPTKTDEWGRPVIVAVTRAIDEDKAQWVRQMFQWYADGHSLRWIAGELNRLHVPTPGAQDRRKHPSTIAGFWFARRLAGGSATFSGILENSTYIGRVVWNRREWLTDPETKRKSARLRPDTDWIVTEHAVEPIVSLPLWQAVQARLQSVRRHTEVPTRGRGPKFLLSSLLRCGLCHRRFVIRDATRYGCPANRVQGCPNGLAVARTLVEEKILSGIRHDLFSQEGIECFVQETMRLLRERQRAQRPDPTASQKHLAKVEREITNIMMAIKQGILTASTKQALEHAEAERARLLAAPVPHAKTLDTLTAFLPNATARYQALVNGLATLPRRHIDQAREQIKALVGEITLHPTPAGHLEAELTGNYAGFLKLAVGQCGHQYGEKNGLYPPQ
jgi:site-specific DNA recombinase